MKVRQQQSRRGCPFLGCHDDNPRRHGRRRGSHRDSPYFKGNLKRAFHYRWMLWVVIISSKWTGGPLYNDMAALGKIMASRRPSAKPFPEPMMTQVADIYMRHSASMSQWYNSNSKSRCFYQQHAIFADLVPFSLTPGCSKYKLRFEIHAIYSVSMKF